MPEPGSRGGHTEAATAAFGILTGRRLRPRRGRFVPTGHPGKTHSGPHESDHRPDHKFVTVGRSNTPDVRQRRFQTVNPPSETAALPKTITHDTPIIQVPDSAEVVTFDAFAVSATDGQQEDRNSTPAGTPGPSEPGKREHPDNGDAPPGPPGENRADASGDDRDAVIRAKIANDRERMLDWVNTRQEEHPGEPTLDVPPDALRGVISGLYYLADDPTQVDIKIMPNQDGENSDGILEFFVVEKRPEQLTDRAIFDELHGKQTERPDSVDPMHWSNPGAVDAEVLAVDDLAIAHLILEKVGEDEDADIYVRNVEIHPDKRNQKGMTRSIGAFLDLAKELGFQNIVGHTATFPTAGEDISSKALFAKMGGMTIDHFPYEPPYSRYRFEHRYGRTPRTRDMVTIFPLLSFVPPGYRDVVGEAMKEHRDELRIAGPDRPPQLTFEINDSATTYLTQIEAYTDAYLQWYASHFFTEPPEAERGTTTLTVDGQQQEISVPFTQTEIDAITQAHIPVDLRDRPAAVQTIFRAARDAEGYLTPYREGTMVIDRNTADSLRAVERLPELLMMATSRGNDALPHPNPAPSMEPTIEITTETLAARHPDWPPLVIRTDYNLHGSHVDLAPLVESLKRSGAVIWLYEDAGPQRELVRQILQRAADQPFEYDRFDFFSAINKEYGVQIQNTIVEPLINAVIGTSVVVTPLDVRPEDDLGQVENAQPVRDFEQRLIIIKRQAKNFVERKIIKRDDITVNVRLEEELEKIFEANPNLKSSKQPVVAFVSRGGFHERSFNAFLQAQGISPQDMSNPELRLIPRNSYDRVLESFLTGEQPRREDLVASRLEGIIHGLMVSDPMEMFYSSVLINVYLNFVTSHFDESEVRKLHREHWKGRPKKARDLEKKRARFNQILQAKGLGTLPRNAAELHETVRHLAPHMPNREIIESLTYQHPLEMLPTQAGILTVQTRQIDTPVEVDGIIQMPTNIYITPEE